MNSIMSFNIPDITSLESASFISNSYDESSNVTNAQPPITPVRLPPLSELLNSITRKPTNFTESSFQSPSFVPPRPLQLPLFPVPALYSAPAHPVTTPKTPLMIKHSAPSAKPTKFQCNICPGERNFSSRQTFRKHLIYCHSEKATCARCNAAVRGDNMARHMKRYCPGSKIKSKG